nr:dysbindin protein homolog [Dermatophagoides farinae]
MFEHIRDRIQHVQQDLTTSFRELTIGTIVDSPATYPTSLSRDKSNLYDLDVNLYAGADVIEYFQHRWIEIQNETKHNANKAQSVSKHIGQMRSHLKNFNKTTDDLESELDKLAPEIHDSLLEIEHELERSLLLLNKLNEAVICLNKEVIDCDHQQRKDESKQKLDEMLIRRAEDLVIYEAQLRSKYERQEVAILKERQLVFQQAFEEELRLYKEKGLVTESNKLKEPSDGTRLEDISLDIDQDEANELEKFLEND